MNRFTMTLLAAAAAAVVATAVVVLPAIGDSGTKGTGKDPDVSDLSACLARHGLPGAPTTGLELKQWLAGKQNQDPRAVQAALDACQPSGHAASPSGPEAARMSACLRSHGLDAPTAPADFKRWVGEQQQADRSKALDDALGACKMALAPQGKAGDAGKSDRGETTDKAPAAKPETPDDTNSK